MTYEPDDPKREELLGLDPKSVDEGDASPPGFDPASLFSEVEASIARDARSPLTRLRELTTPMRILLTSAVSFAVASIVGITACRTDLATYSTARLALEATVLAAALVGTLSLAMRPSQRPELDRGRLAVALGSGLAVAFAIATIPAPQAGAAPLGPIAPPDWSAGLPCLTIGLLVGIPIYLIARALDRGSSRTAYLAAGAAGIAGNLALTMHCPLGDVGHRVSTHASLGIVFLVSLALAATLEHRFGRR